MLRRGEGALVGAGGEAEGCGCVGMGRGGDGDGEECGGGGECAESEVAGERCRCEV
jgi:hypothetical protein